MTNPSLIKLNESITCQGLTVRTKNADEMNPSRAKISTLWQNFQQQFATQMTQDTQVYGVYHNYESDMNGEFDVTACIADLKLTEDTLTEVIIASGDYLVFRKQGAMPQAVIDAWGDVWHYFTSDDCQHKRTYDHDFEKYIGMDTVEIYISV